MRMPLVSIVTTGRSSPPVLPVCPPVPAEAARSYMYTQPSAAGATHAVRARRHTAESVQPPEHSTAQCSWALPQRSRGRHGKTGHASTVPVQVGLAAGGDIFCMKQAWQGSAVQERSAWSPESGSTSPPERERGGCGRCGTPHAKGVLPGQRQGGAPPPRSAPSTALRPSGLEA